ncbi:MAG: hypothetical protein AAF647_00105, partial [Pseudomonadota bacterium]
FKRDERGVASIEGIILIPLLFWAFIGTFVIFHAFKTQTEGLRATYAIADAISREDGEVDSTYFNSIYDLAKFMTDGAPGLAQRYTIVCQSPKEADKLRVAWSIVRFPPQPANQPLPPEFVPLNSTSINTEKDRLPTIPVGDQLILVETFLPFTPVWSFNPVWENAISAQTFDYFIFTRPRFTSQLKFKGQPNWVCPNF